MWSVWLVFCDCGFHSVCAVMDKYKRLWKLPDGKDDFGEIGSCSDGQKRYQISLFHHHCHHLLPWSYFFLIVTICACPCPAPSWILSKEHRGFWCESPEAASEECGFLGDPNVRCTPIPTDSAAPLNSPEAARLRLGDYCVVQTLPRSSQKFFVHGLLKHSVKGFERNSASMWNECNCTVVWTFLVIAFPWDWNENKLQEMVKGREDWCAAVHRHAESDMTKPLNNNTLKHIKVIYHWK